MSSFLFLSFNRFLLNLVPGSWFGCHLETSSLWQLLDVSILSVSGIRFLSLPSSLPSFSFFLSSLHLSCFFHPRKERSFKNTKWEFSVRKGRRKILKEERFEKMISITVWIMESKRLTFLAFQLFLTDHPLSLWDCYLRRGSQRERKKEVLREKKKFLEREELLHAEVTRHYDKYR